MTQKATRQNQDILGYKLKSKLGAGGYGEVWSAEAPGGIMKAVKIVFGYHDEQRATNELRSLDRIKDLRHPFLLNLERIDIVDGQLVIITELADKSLADEFDHYLEQGGKGIPREILLPQLMEAADALDFITFKHSLLHLDIKPENLLMVGRHIKVADFGLVKDLKDVTQSLMGGLTPAYAAPELFDGKPSNTSDQYSLAIVFQEMLTGERPFPGTTPASLAAQHVSGRPNLRPLAKGDQQVIAKALSKDSKLRYSNCVDMIQDLINRNTARKTIRRRVIPSRNRQDTESTNVKIKKGVTPADATALISNSFVADKPAERIDAPDCSGVESTFRPTLVVGVGNSANQILKQLYQKVAERCSNPKNLPSLRFLCVDTDRTEIAELSRSLNGETTLTGSETLHLPLRKPEEYRNRQKHLLSWLSRRWIYNVPRSQQTEGIRPLGRLAFIDNFNEFHNVIEDHAQKLSKPEMLAETSEILGLAPGAHQKPQVFLLASISGGTGSGMMADMAYTIKLILGEHGLSESSIHGLMLNSSSVQAGDPGLAAANAFAFLTELRHYNQYGFPGDSSRGLPELPNESPFDFSYYLDLGTNLSEERLNSKFDSIAEYLFLNTVSSANNFFEECRKFEDKIEHFALRGVGITQSGFGPSKWNKRFVEQLCTAVVDKWIRGTEGSQKAVEEAVAKFQNSEFSFASNDVLDAITEETNELSENPRVVGLKEFLVSALGEDHSFDMLQLAEQAETVFGTLDLATSNVSTQTSPTVCTDLEQWARKQAETIGSAICQPLTRLLGEEKMDLAAPSLLCQWYLTEIQRQRIALEKLLEKNQTKLREICGELLNFNEVMEVVPIESKIVPYIQNKIQEARIVYADLMLSFLGSYVGDSCDHYVGYVNELKMMVASRFSETEEPETEGMDFFDKTIAEQLGAKIPALVGNVEMRLYHELVQEAGGFEQALLDNSFIQYQLPENLRAVAQIELSSGATRLEIDEALVKSGLSNSVIADWIRTVESKSMPMLDECGGKIRQAVCMPTNCKQTKVGNCFLQKTTRTEICKATFGDLILVSETEDVPLANVAFRLLQSRPDCIELTKRLHTRNDVEWLTLEDIL